MIMEFLRGNRFVETKNKIHQSVSLCSGLVAPGSANYGIGENWTQLENEAITQSNELK
jgi:hypothetical protein